MTNVVCFGFNPFGQLLQTSERGDVINKIKKSRVTHVSFTWSYSILILDNGEIFKKGFINNEFNAIEQIIPPFKERVVKVIASKEYDFYLCENGICWVYDSLKKQFTELYCDTDTCLADDGNNEMFINIIDIARKTNLFILLSNKGIIYNIHTNEKIIPNPNLKVIQVACGAGHSVCLTENGSVFTWGIGSRGELGNGSLETVCNPELLRALDGIKIISVACGEWHTAVISEAGDLYTWGWNSDGQLGFEPSSVSGEENKEQVSVVTEPKIVNLIGQNPEALFVKQVSCGIRHTIMLLDDDTLWGCGWNKHGQIDAQSKDVIIFPVRQIVIPNERIPYKIDCVEWNTVVYFK